MLSKVSFWSPEKLNQKGSSVNMSFLNLKSSSPAVGLRILTAAEASRRDSNNIVTNSDLNLIKPIFPTNQSHNSSNFVDSCFLKSCFLCNKTLRLDKDVYMYRGDKGFCSAECRSRQIYLDEVKEIEESTKKTLASFRRCRECNWDETKTLLEEFRQRHRQPMSRQKDRINQAPIFTFS